MFVERLTVERAFARVCDEQMYASRIVDPAIPARTHRKRMAWLAGPWLARLGWAALALAACLALASGIGRAGAEGRAAGGAEPTYEQITVEPGDTLWGIADQRYPGSDVRAMVYEIEQINGLSGPVIMAGQRLKVPAR